MTQEYRVKVTVRNNLLLSAVEAAGYVGHGSIGRFCADAGIDASQFSSLASFRTSPITKDGDFSVHAKAVMEALGAAPSDLWTDEQLYMKIGKNSSTFSAGQAEVMALLEWRENAAVDPEGAAADSMLRRAIAASIEKLPRGDQNVLRMRFGLDGVDERTLEECGFALGVTRERVRQIEARALRRLRTQITEGDSPLAGA